MHRTKQHEGVNSSVNPTLLWAYSQEMIANQAEIECDETPQKVRDGLYVIKESIRKNQLKCPEDDGYLLKFLRIKKFRHPDSYNMLEGFTKCLKAFAERVGYPDKESLKKIYEKNVTGILPGTDPDGRPIMFHRFGAYTKEGLSIDDAGKAIQTVLYAMMEQPIGQTHGVNYIIDCKEMGLPHVYDSLSTGVLYCRLLSKLPLRIHRIDVIHDFALFKTVLNVLKAFLPTEILQRIYCHGDDLEHISEVYGSSSLPNEFGGTAGPLSNDHWMDKLETILQHLIKLEEKAAS